MLVVATVYSGENGYWKWEGLPNYYRIVERSDGQLVYVVLWCKTWKDPEPDPRYVFATIKQGDGRWNSISTTPVTPEEAEEITGLHMPAAMDRLRELVHERR